MAKLLITENNALGCDDHKTWTPDDWRYIIRSDESSTLFPTSGWVSVWTTPKEAYSHKCLVPTVKHGGSSVMIWAVISWYSVGPLNGRITASNYVDISVNQVHTMKQKLFHIGDAIFQDDNSPIHTARSVQSFS